MKLPDWVKDPDAPIFTTNDPLVYFGCVMVVSLVGCALGLVVALAVIFGVIHLLGG